MKKEKELDAAIVLAALEKEGAPLIKALKRIEIGDKQSYELKSSKMDALKGLAKLAEQKEKTFTDPLSKLLKDVKKLFAPFRNRVKELEAETKAEMVAYVDKLEQAKIKVKNDLESGKIAKLSTAVRKTAELEINSATSSVRKVWTLKITDVGDIPREYLIPDEAKIKEAFKAGKKVTGCKWYQKNTIAI